MKELLEWSLLFCRCICSRYLRPANFGLLSYAGSFVGLFSAIATLGLDSILVRELVKEEKKRDELLGTTFILKFIGSIIVVIIILIVVRFTDNDNFASLLIYIIVIGTINLRKKINRAGEDLISMLKN